MAHVILVGAGAIGSHALPHLARLQQVSAVTVIDRDRYDQANLRSQDIARRDVGEPKAVVQARRLERINRHISGLALHRSVEDLPLGSLRCDVILSCVDSRKSRMAINQAAWRLGVPWINAGIDATGLLVRVQVFVPTGGAACLECAWDERDYELVEQAYPCAGRTPSPATDAPSALGALAASLQVLECQKLLAHQSPLLAGRDVLLDARHHRHYVTAFARNAGCRMPDHTPWNITPLDLDLSTTPLGELIAVGSTLRGANAGLRMSVAGRRFVQSPTCLHCNMRHRTALAQCVEQPRASSCPSCARPLVAAGVDLYDDLELDALPEVAHNSSLADIGLTQRDVVTLTTPDVEAHFELGGVA
jgi:molybdopterin/thiamine biosynthesis adenylyltransferase